MLHNFIARIKDRVHQGSVFYYTSAGLLIAGALQDRKKEAFILPTPYGKTGRPDQKGEHRKLYRLNKRKILATQSICAICGKPVDKKIKYPDPLSPCVDHIIPVAKGGHPSDISNLQLAHWACNRAKSDKIVGTESDFKLKRDRAKIVGNRNLPLATDWLTF